MANQDTQKLAEQIAKLLKGEGASGLEHINQRLNQIEDKLNSQAQSSPSFTPKLSHPSQQKFDVIEAIADEIIENHQEEKTCTFEPNGKPCDHCSMCSSMGF